MNKKNTIYIILAILLGILTRTVWHVGPNIEFVTALAVSGAIFLGASKTKYLIPLFIMIFSDLIIGNSLIFIFTWSAFLFIPLLTTFASKTPTKNNNKFFKGLVVSLTSGFVGILIFYLWTNLGVVLIGDMYSKDISGLVTSYINALPFLRPQIVGNIFIIPLIYSISYLFYNLKLELFGKSQTNSF